MYEKIFPTVQIHIDHKLYGKNTPLHNRVNLSLRTKQKQQSDAQLRKLDRGFNYISKISQRGHCNSGRIHQFLSISRSPLLDHIRHATQSNI